MPGAGETMSVGALLSEGGWTMVPIYLCSIATLAIFVRKIFELRACALHKLAWVDGVTALVAGGRYEAALAACQQVTHPGGRVLAATVAALASKPQQAEAEARRIGSLELQRLEKNVGTLSFLAQVAPLLGLLGTVLGMVDLFLALQQAGHSQVEVTQLSSGIWKALLTTAAGLVVAVPALAAHDFLAGRVDMMRLQLADIVQRVLYAAPDETSRSASQAANRKVFHAV